jgi:hypothetical protein
VIREVDRKKRLSWCREKRKLGVDNYCRIVIFLDESKIEVGQDARIYIWRKRGEGWRPDLVEARRTKPCFSVMFWGCISWQGVGTLSAVEGNINAELDVSSTPRMPPHSAKVLKPCLISRGNCQKSLDQQFRPNKS